MSERPTPEQVVADFAAVGAGIGIVGNNVTAFAALGRIEAEVKALRAERETADQAAFTSNAAWAEMHASERTAREAAERVMAYVEGVLMRDPFNDTQRFHAAETLRAALAATDTTLGRDEHGGTFEGEAPRG